jgi:hypothetical protein
MTCGVFVENWRILYVLTPGDSTYISTCIAPASVGYEEKDTDYILLLRILDSCQKSNHPIRQVLKSSRKEKVP